MSAPEPRANALLLGQEPAEAVLLEALCSGRMHHAWLITGPEGVGKATLAFRFARRLLAGRIDAATDSLAVPPKHPVFRRVAAESHADLLTVEREYDPKRKRMKTLIAVDDVRDIPKFMALTPAEDGWRVVIIDGAEDMSPSSANALLKVLEEPPSRAVLLLVCGAPGRLLPTIRSRCRRLQLAALDDSVMDKLLDTYLPQMPPDERHRLITLAEGSVGRALLLAEEHGLALATLVDEVLAAGPNLKMSRAYELADTITRADGAFSTFMDLLRAAITVAVRDTVRGRADPDQSRLIATRPLEAWGEVWDALTRLQDETERFNLDKRQAIVAGLGMFGQQSNRVTPS